MSDQPPLVTTLPNPKKRRRPALSCEQCRRRKVRCDRGTPCATCVQTGAPTCSYAPRPGAPLRPARTVLPTPPESSVGGGLDGSYPFIGKGEWKAEIMQGGSEKTEGVDVESLVERIRQLEWQVETGKRAPGPARVEGDDAPLKGILEKTRFLGQSHWINAICLVCHLILISHSHSRLTAANNSQFQFLIDLNRKSEARKDEIYDVLHECKILGRRIKASRNPTLNSATLATTLVSHAVSDHLLSLYLSTFELAHRVVHIPSFTRDYARFKDDPSSVGQSFKMQLQLCLAIGASMRDSRFEMRGTAIQWVYEARLWLVMPSEKDRISVTGVQVMCLLQLARQAVGVAPGVAWPDAGSLLRSAMFAGLHRDPKRLPAMTVLRAEVRRRLWATILEMTIQTCVDAGAPPLFSLDDYDTEPPLNVDDDELTDDPEPPERPTQISGRHTQTSLQLLLLSHFPVRLAVTKFANEFRSSNSYDEALRLHEQITSACQTISRSLAGLVASTAVSSAPVTIFHQRYIELMTRRYILALHYPFLQKLDDPAYYFSRKVISDVARRLAPLHRLPAGVPPPPGAMEFVNMSICSTGFARTVMQGFILIGPELISIKREEMASYGEAGDGGAELRKLLCEGVEWAEARTRAGEVNVKGHLFIEGILSEADGVSMGLEGEELEGYMVGKMKTAMEGAHETLKELARDVGLDGKGTPEGMVDLSTPVTFHEGIGPGDPFDMLGWQLDWEDLSNMSSFMT